MSKLYGIGVGPGDPELMTLKAVRIIKECDVIFVPGKVVKDTVAYRIAKGAVKELEEKECIPLYMPMTKDVKLLEESHQACGKKVLETLKRCEKAAFLTLGDVSIYSTFLYIKHFVEQYGVETEMISGIPSFCATAAKLNIGLVEGKEELHILPASYQIREGLSLSGTKVLMKSGKKIAQVKELLKEKDVEVKMVENCGMENEKVYQKAEEIPEDAGYYSLIIVKEKE